MHCGCLDEKEKKKHTHTHAVAHTLRIDRVKRNKFSRSLLRAAGMSDSRFIRWIRFDRILWINRFTFTMTHFFRVAFKFQNEFHFGEEFFFEWHLFRRSTTPLHRKSTEHKHKTQEKEKEFEWKWKWNVRGISWTKRTQWSSHKLVAFSFGAYLYRKTGCKRQCFACINVGFFGEKICTLLLRLVNLLKANNKQLKKIQQNQTKSRVSVSCTLGCLVSEQRLFQREKKSFK